MKKLFFIFAIAITLFGCSDNSSSPQICEKKQLYYEDVVSTRYKDQYYTQWLKEACIDHYEPGFIESQAEYGIIIKPDFDNCSSFDYKYYLTIEECGDIYIKE